MEILNVLMCKIVFFFFFYFDQFTCDDSMVTDVETITSVQSHVL